MPVVLKERAMELAALLWSTGSCPAGKRSPCGWRSTPAYSLLEVRVMGVGSATPPWGKTSREPAAVWMEPHPGVAAAAAVQLTEKRAPPRRVTSCHSAPAGLSLHPPMVIRIPASASAEVRSERLSIGCLRTGG